MKEAEICTALCAPEIPIKDYSGVIGELAYFLPAFTGLHHSDFFSTQLVSCYISSGLLVLKVK